MKLIIKISKLLFIVLFLQSCTAEKKEISIIKEMDQEQEMISSYKEGMDSLERGESPLSNESKSVQKYEDPAKRDAKD